MESKYGISTGRAGVTAHADGVNIFNMNNHKHPGGPPRAPAPKPKKPHPMTQQSGISPHHQNPGLTTGLNPPPKQMAPVTAPTPGVVAYKELPETIVDGKRCKNYEESPSLFNGFKTIKDPKKRQDCKTDAEWKEREAVQYYKETRQDQTDADLGNKTFSALPEAWKNWGEQGCNTANKTTGGWYTFWDQNGYDVDTTIYAHKGTQGMSDRPIKLPPKPEARNKLGPDTYNISYNWNSVSQRCERKVIASDWLRDALTCTGSITSTCDLGRAAGEEFRRRYDEYNNAVAAGGGRSQGLEDFFNAGLPLLKIKEENAKNCTNDGWWDNFTCTTSKGWDKFVGQTTPVLLAAAAVVVVVILK